MAATSEDTSVTRDDDVNQAVWSNEQQEWTTQFHLHVTPQRAFYGGSTIDSKTLQPSRNTRCFKHFDNITPGKDDAISSLMNALQKTHASSLSSPVGTLVNDEVDLLKNSLDADQGIANYVCHTENDHETEAHNIRSAGLGFYTNSFKAPVVRWTPGSTLFYYVDPFGFNDTHVAAIKAGMLVAADRWQATGVPVTFQATVTELDATFSVAFDTKLEPHIYALAFFPAQTKRVIHIGNRLLRELDYVVEVLGHELGHVLGLRHEFWKDNRERGYAYHYPSEYIDKDSIMNDRNVGDLSKFVISLKDAEIIRDFYNLPSGSHCGFDIEDLVPRPAAEHLGSSLPRN